MSTTAKPTKSSEEIGDINIAIKSGIIPGTFNDDMTLFKFPSITYTIASGKKSTYNVAVRLKNENGQIIPIDTNYLQRPAKIMAGSGEIIVESSQENGKIRDTPPIVINTGKNLGKANATNAIMQTFKEAYSKYQDKLRKTNPPVDVYEPMLVTKIGDSKQATLAEGDYKNGLFVQFKLDGHRGIIHGTRMYSRTGIDYLGVEVFTKPLTSLFAKYPDLYVDGEAYKHGLSLSNISSIMRKEDTKEGTGIEFHIYDVFFPKTNPTMPYFERLKFINENLRESEFIKIVATHEIHSVEEVDVLKTRAKKENYEGLIVRKPTGVYEHRRSTGILKIKDRLDNEFNVLNYVCGIKGKDVDAIIWVCSTEDGKEFHVVPNMELTKRKKLYLSLKEHVGDFEKYFLNKPMTVEYAQLSDDNIPLQAKGVGFRTYEDVKDETNEYLTRL